MNKQYRPIGHGFFARRNPLLIAGAFLLWVVCVVCSVTGAMTHSAAAAQTVPYRINFQGHLTAADGTLLPDGQYNMTFRFYSGATGGSPLWTEVRDLSDRVTVTNGRFAVQLGSVTPLPASLFNSQSRYLEVELPAPATATCSTIGCATYTEGPMTPRQQVASSPYAFNADRLDGLDATAFAKIGGNNTFTGTNVFKNASDSTSAFSIQQANGTSLLNVDTTNGIISIGTTTRGSAGATFGRTTIGSNTQYDGSTSMNMVQYQTGATAGNTTTISAHFDSNIETVPTSQIQMALYTDRSDSPYGKVAETVVSTLTAGWNTLTIDATLEPNTIYWLAVIVTHADVDKNNMTYESGGTALWFSHNFEDGFPLTVSGGNSLNESFDMYVSFESANSTVSPLFTVNSQDNVVQIGASAPTSTPTLFVLDSKDTAADPPGVPGAMYYNSALGKFRCFEVNTWKNCIP